MSFFTGFPLDCPEEYASTEHIATWTGNQTSEVDFGDTREFTAWFVSDQYVSKRGFKIVIWLDQIGKVLVELHIV